MSSRNKSDVKKLFEFWCEVSCVDNRSGSIIEQFPENYRDVKTMADIPAFAFPCEFENDSVQLFSFVLTTDDSKWRYGFCRQDPKTKSAMIIITYLPWHDIFLKLLTVLAELRRSATNELSKFLFEAYNNGVPDPGGSLKLFYSSGQSTFVFERPLQFQLPSIPENHNLNLYYNFVDPKNMILIFSAMLAERRIIFTSRRLDRLSSCIQAANAFLFPMVWQHIFIPVLPMKLKDYLSAPMPYLIGVPQMVLETMSPEELGEVVILNCDTKICENPFSDVQDMPSEIVAQMKKQLSQSQEHIGDRVSKIFLGVLVQLIGGYRDAVEFHETEKTFNREKFIETRPSHLRPFLTKMMDLQIFQQFVDERLDMLNAGLGLSDEFELEIARYMEKRRRHNRFLQNVKDKTNPAVKSAVKTVKERSREVKTAYRGLKSKLTPPSNSHFQSHLQSTSKTDRIDGYNYNSRHCSAPSSPITSRVSANSCDFQYACSEAFNGTDQYILRRSPIIVSNSNTQIHSSGNTEMVSASNSAHLRLITSPTVSPANSVCSSEMNLSQELQSHPLFRIADRSSKPSKSVELKNCNPIIRSHERCPSGVASRALLQNQRGDIAKMQAFTYSSSATKTLLVPPNSYMQVKQPQMLVQTPLSMQISSKQEHRQHFTSTPNKYITTKSMFDNPPEMQSPPIPPRRHHNNNNNSCVGKPTVSSNKKHESKSWENYMVSNALNGDALRCSSFSDTSNSSSSSDSTASFVTALSFFQQPILSGPPAPAQRFKRERETAESLQTLNQKPTSTSPVKNISKPAIDSNSLKKVDLISLEDNSSASYDLEDFDPLNHNAKPLPIDHSGKRSTTLPLGSSLIETTKPHYKMQAPSMTVQAPPLPTSKPPSMISSNEDVELLRKYGLDQFSLTTPTSKNKNRNTLNASITRNWTTFD